MIGRVALLLAATLAIATAAEADSVGRRGACL